MKIEVGDYIICNVGKGNELIHVREIKNDSLIGVRFCAPNSGNGKFQIWTDPTQREYPLTLCQLFCKSLKREILKYD